MPKIFISYRREDAAYVAQQVSKTLKTRLGEQSVFFDISEIEWGDEFPEVIAEALEQSDILLAIIGARWLDAKFSSGSKQGQRRLDDPGDFVRREIATALGREIPVLPVVIEGVSLSAIAPHLPSDLQNLARKNEIPFRSGHDLTSDLKRLVQAVKSILLPPLTAAELALPPGVKVAPQGLRSFGQDEKEFFTYLLPDPDPSGALPKQLFFWKSRIEELNASNTFRIGLIYGPSGCGKSSLVKAGLLPRLAPHVTAVHVEASATETEATLLASLHKCCPLLSRESDLRTALDRKQQIPAGEKVLLVLDQFEQYLHATPDDDQEYLAEALRKCDGEKFQCILMIRDDFLTPITRFMNRLQIQLRGDDNMAMVDLFNKRHAKKVLALLGQGYGGLPLLAKGNKFSKDQNEFLNQAIADLAEGDHVISVRLALFAQMFRANSWSPEILKAIGGATGVGVAFLEESLAAQTASEKHRRHQAAAQKVLAALLPEPGATIKGAMRTKPELLDQSGYAQSPAEFDQLLDLLDKTLRLVTPTESIAERSEDEAKSTGDAEKRYQLTHDYLVPSLREWLIRKQKETPEGRAELLLEESADLWNAGTIKPLPTLPQWVEIHSLTNKTRWSEVQRRMMDDANRFHLLSVKERLLNANTADVLNILKELGQYQSWVGDPLLEEVFREAITQDDPRKQLHARLALLLADAGQTDFLCERLLAADLHEVPVILDALTSHKESLLDKLWSFVETTELGTGSQRLRGAAALAKYDPQSEKWANSGRLVVDDLVLENSIFLGQWSDLFRPIAQWLLSALADIFRDRDSERAAERTLATNLLADYAADNPQVLADLLMDADEKQFDVIFPVFQDCGKQGLPLLTGEVDQKPPSGATDEVKEKLAKRQANAAVALLRINHPAKVWPLLQHSPDPRTRSYLIHRLSPLGAEPDALIEHLEDEPDISIRRAVLLSLGEFEEKELSPAARNALLRTLQEMYHTASDPGLHAASEWLLRIWKQGAWLKQVNDQWTRDQEQRDRRLDGISQLLKYEKERATPQWYVNGQGQTMIVIPGPLEFTMGSPLTETGRQEDERQHMRRIGRTFALSAKSVTLEQYRAFEKDYQLPEIYTRTADLPVVGIDWYRGANYCNWLSEQEGLPADQWCYEIQNGQVTKLKKNYLSLTGYRLPTEAEMEYATRAGASTSRYFGETDELLPNYAWYQKNSQEQIWPVGSLKPNDLGLFDANGNVFTWCQESFNDYPHEGETIDDKEDGLEIVSTASRVLRGGSFILHSSTVRSAFRNNHVPPNRYSTDGFRSARTLPHIPFTPLPPTPKGSKL